MWAAWSQRLARTPRLLLAIALIDVVFFTGKSFITHPADWGLNALALVVAVVVWAYLIKGVQWLTRVVAAAYFAWIGFALGKYGDGKGVFGLGWEHGPDTAFALVAGVYLLMFRIRPSRAEWGRFPLVPSSTAASASPMPPSSAPAR